MVGEDPERADDWPRPDTIVCAVIRKYGQPAVRLNVTVAAEGAAAFEKIEAL
jgi:hypothetical protein